MFVVVGDEKARMQFFRDIAHQKVDNQRHLEIYVGDACIKHIHVLRQSDDSFWMKVKKMPLKYQRSGPYNRLTAEGYRWNSVFSGYLTETWYFELAQSILDNHRRDLSSNLLVYLTHNPGGQILLNSFLSEEDTGKFMLRMREFIDSRGYHANDVLRPVYITCSDKGDYYQYNVFNEDFERPYEEGLTSE